jgi:hypothetical protein
MKTKSRSFVILGLCLLVLCIMPLSFTVVTEAQDSSEIPGVPDDAVHFDRMGMTPDQKMEQIMAGTMHVYRYQHVTMLMNCSQNMVMNMTSDAQVRNRIVGLDIEADQPFQLSVQMMGEPPAGVQTLQGTLNTYWTLELNATLQLQVQLRLHINEAALKAELNREVNREQLRWMFWNHEQARWEPVDSSMDADGYLVCETNHFSIWTVAEVDYAGFLTLTMELMIVILVVVVVAGTGVILVRRRSAS